MAAIEIQLVIIAVPLFSIRIGPRFAFFLPSLHFNYVTKPGEEKRSMKHVPSRTAKLRGHFTRSGEKESVEVLGTTQREVRTVHC